jgi:gas vesicle protein
MQRSKDEYEAMVTHNDEDSKSYVKTFFGGLLVGAIIGTGAMFLYAPKSGRKSRAKLQHQFDELRDQVQERIEDLEEEMRGQAKHTTHEARGKMKNLRQYRERVFPHK